MMDHILVPLDGSRESEVALPHAAELAKRANSQLTLVRAAHVPTVSTSRTRTQTVRIQAAQTYLDERAAELANCGLTVDTRVP